MLSKLTTLFQDIPVWKYSLYEFEITTPLSKEEIVKIIEEELNDIHIPFFHDKKYFYGSVNNTTFSLHPIYYGSHLDNPRITGVIQQEESTCIVKFISRMNYYANINIILITLIFIFCIFYIINISIKFDFYSILYIIIPLYIVACALNSRNTNFTARSEAAKAKLFKMLCGEAVANVQTI